MEINGTTVIDNGDSLSFKFENSTIITNKNSGQPHLNHLRILATVTTGDTLNVGQFKKNAKNMLIYVKDTLELDGVYFNKKSLFPLVKAGAETGVVNGWVIDDGSVYKIENID